MKKIITLGVASLALLFSLNSVQAAALPQWDTSGTWNIAFDYLGSTYTHDMTLAQDATGTLTGMGGFPAGGPHAYAWMVDSGSMVADSVHLETHYTLGAVCSMTIDGIVATSTGTMSGTWSDNCDGTRNGTWVSASGTATTLLPAPTPLSPSNGYSTTTVGLTKIDWTDVTGALLPITYVYQVSNSALTNPDGSFVTPIYTSGTLAVSEINTPGTPEGTYYWHVKAVDTSNTSSPWSTTWSVTVDNTPIVVVPPTTPTDKSQCKKNGWKTFTNPSFKNQGQCVSWTNHN